MMGLFKKTRVRAFAFLLAVSAGAHAQVVDSVRSCASVQDNERRLACYDAAVGELGAHAAPEASSQISATKPAGGGQPADNFGATGSELAKKRAQEKEQSEEGSRELTARITKIERLPRGELLVTLDNGHVWRQKQVQSTFVLRVGEAVTIKRGTLGSHRLVNASGRATAVTRIE